ncbi:MAG: helix-turn-helix transcriptional regulator [Clostridia bacterium]|nr:helix-turn-helix transcriptional regulator [Clostridia bacterium]
MIYEVILPKAIDIDNEIIYTLICTFFPQVNQMNILPMPVSATHSIMHRKNFLWPHASYKTWWLIIPLSGCFSCTMQGRTWTVSEGDLCFFPPGIVFDRYVIEDLYLHYINITWNCTDDVLKESSYFPIGCVNLRDKARLQSTLNMLSTMAKTFVPCRETVTTHYISDIWMQFLTDYGSLISKLPEYTNDPVIDKAIDYFTHNLHTSLSMPDVAAHCGLSPVQLSKKFTQIVGISPVKYLTSLRMQKAQRLLADTDLLVSQVSAMCGYENPLYFSRRFRETTGISPQQYKESLKKV